MNNDCFDLTKEQEGLWFEYKLRPQDTSYNAYVITKIEGLLDLERFLEAEYESINHLYTPRTKLQENDKGHVQQYILPKVEQRALYFDLSESTSEESSDAQAKKIIKEIADKPFDLENDRLLRTVLVCVSEKKFYYMTCQHHIICDSWSAGIYHNVLAYIYNNGTDGVHSVYPQKTVKEYSQARAEIDGGERAKVDAEKYWSGRLDGAKLHFDLGVNYDHLLSIMRKELKFVLGEKINEQLKVLARKNRTTLFLVLMAMINVLLHRYWSKKDICIGYDVNSRPKGFKEVAGYFIKVFPMRILVEDDDTFTSLVKKITEERKSDSKYQNISFPEIVESYRKKEKSTGHNLNIFLGQTSFELDGMNLNELDCQTVDVFAGSMNLDLEFTYDPILNELPFLLRYNGNKFSDDFMSCLIKNFQVLINSVIDCPDAKLANLDLIDSEEKKILLDDWNNNSVYSPSGISVNKLFEDQVGKSPDKVAVICGDDEITYDELNKRSNRLARYLLSLGGGHTGLVGVYLSRSVDMVVALLAVMKSGAAFVPLDPIYPQDRLKFVIENSAPELILTESSLAKSLPEIGPNVVVLDNIAEDALSGASSIDLLPVAPSDRMYVIYTSGSTGVPKGVQISHRNVVNFLKSMEKRPGFTGEDSLLAVTTISFDISVLELFLPLIAGGRVVVLSSVDSINAESIQSAISCHNITVMQATPSTWQMLENIGWQGDKGLKVLCGGEPLPSLLASRLLGKVGSLWNMYGPTETTIWSTLSEVNDPEQISIGKPIDNTEIYVLDSNLSLCPVGVPGSLYIGGQGVSEGYFNRDELTSERFVVNPFLDDLGDIIYNTGDLCRYLPDGNIVHLGRIDNQIKLRGYRIELGEIEAVLCQHEDVEQAVVVVSGDTLSGRYLVAYIVLSQDGQGGFQLDRLKEFVRGRLPEYMIPLAFVELLDLPLLPNGKVDNKALPEPDNKTVAAETSYVPPKNENEKVISQIWSEVLGRDKIGMHDNFFDMGGNSILLTKIYSRLRGVLDSQFNLIDMFKYPTVYSFLNSLNGAEAVVPLPRKMSVGGRKARMSSMNQKRRSRKKSH